MPAPLAVDKEAAAVSGALDNPRWEQFCHYILSGETQVSAYRLAFGNKNEGSAGTLASLLMKRPEIQARLSSLRKSTGMSGAVLSMSEKRRFLRDVVNTPPGQIDENSPLCQSYKKRIRTERDGTTEETIEYELPNKLKALELDAKLAGEMDAGGERVSLQFFEITMNRGQVLDERPVIDVEPAE